MIDEKILIEYKISLSLENPSSKPVILTDCMDTVVSRDMHLDGVLKAWARKVAKKFSLYAPFLYRYRREVVLGNMHNVVPIEVIYRELFKHCAYYGMLPDAMEDEFIYSVHNIEMDIELDSQHLIKKTVEFLKKQRNKGCKIFCVSDFRLPASDIKRFFDFQKIGDLFDDVFSSCEIGKTKKDGSMYQSVLKIINEPSSNCLMIGDNLESDCINAYKNGISGCLIR